jgi:fatty acid desaturase
MNATASKAAPALRPPVRAANASPSGTNKRAIWDCVIGIAGLIYLGMVLVENLYSPVLGLLWVVLAAYKLLEPRCGKGCG